jgi:bifunctional non-homologous end joining protein LigD
MHPLPQTSLYFSEGRSDKEYHTEIVEAHGGYAVTFRYGRRGSVLTSGTKTSVPVDLDHAKAIFDKLVKEKTAKGYAPDVSGTAYQGTDCVGQPISFMPQLLNPLTEQQAIVGIADIRWAAQQKMDGERRAALADAHQVIGANRKGFRVPLPQGIADELQAIAIQQGTLYVDGEIIGDCLYVFDLHVHQGRPLHAVPWIERMRLAEVVLAGCTCLKPVPVAVTTEEKFALWEKVKSEAGEGIVFKRMSAPISSGRPNSGGDWLKFKFIESASCYVIGVNPGKRSIQIGVWGHGVSSATAEEVTQVGKVTIPPNHPIPEDGAIVEVEYLYAYPGGSLYQPVYRGKRLDLDITDCTTAQLKYKPCVRDNNANEQASSALTTV